MPTRSAAPPFRMCWAYVLRLVVVNTGAAVLAAIVLLWLSPITWPNIGSTFLLGALYSFSIGSPAGMILPYVAEAIASWRMGAKLFLISGVIILITAAGCLVAGMIAAAADLMPGGAFWDRYWWTLKLSSIMAVVVGCSVFAYEHLRDKLQETRFELQARQLEQERAQKLAAEAQLSSLESRIHPHFLFNTLNSIASLIPEDPKRADEIVGRLAALLRFSLDSHRGRFVPLSQELKIVRDYLEIERARFGGRLTYEIDVGPELEDAQVPPLSVHTLVENSVKHAIAPLRGGGDVRVAVRSGLSDMTVEVSDSGPGFALEKAPPGHGLENLLSRLSVLYGGAARVECARDNGRASVRLALPKTGSAQL